MKTLIALAACLSLGCTPAPGDPEPVSTPVRVRSHNESPVDVFLICAWTRNALWLGTIDGQGSDALEIPAGQPRCAEGRRFFLVVQNAGRGYWVDPVRPGPGQAVQLVIEEFAGFSTASLRSVDLPDPEGRGRNR